MLFILIIKWWFLHIVFPFLIKFSGLQEILFHYIGWCLLTYSLMHDLNLLNFFFGLEFILCGILHLCKYSKVSVTSRGCIIDFCLERNFFNFWNILLDLLQFFIIFKFIFKSNCSLDSSISDLSRKARLILT